MFSERLRQKIKILNDLTLFDHYKSKDMYYTIECIYDSGNGSVEYYPAHNGYIWDTDQYEWYKETFTSFKEAEKALEKAVDAQLKTEFSWYYDKNEGYFHILDKGTDWGILENPNISSTEDVNKYYARWKALTE